MVDSARRFPPRCAFAVATLGQHDDAGAYRGRGVDGTNCVRIIADAVVSIDGCDLDDGNNVARRCDRRIGETKPLRRSMTLQTRWGGLGTRCRASISPP